jgi:hypothetical protein
MVYAYAYLQVFKAIHFYLVRKPFLKDKILPFVLKEGGLFSLF